MLIELVGLPGSGKTTFAKRLAEGGRFTVVKIANPFELLWYNALFFARHPTVSLRTFIWLCRHRGDARFWYAKLTNLFLQHNAKYMKAARYARAVIDQGHHQNALSLFDMRIPDRVLDRYVAILPKPDLLCFFVADKETRDQRLRSRGYGARDEWEGDTRRQWEGASAEHMEWMYVSRASLPIPTETITTEDSEEKLAKIAHAHVFNFVMHARMPTEKAHGLQMAKTLEALILRGAYVSLTVPRRRNPIRVSVGEYYSLAPEFPVHYLWSPDLLRLPTSFGAARFFLDAIGFLFALLYLRIDREAVYYTRHPEVAWYFKLRGAQVWYEAHLFPESKHWLLKFLLHRVDGVVANSRGTKDAFTGAGFTNVHVVRNGADIDRFTNAPKQHVARAELGLPEGKRIVCYGGAFYAWKGVPLLLEAWQRNFGDRDDLLLLLVGGDENDLRRYGGHAAFVVSRNVHLVSHVSTEKMPVYFSAADVLVLPNIPEGEESIRYTSPIKLFEYMASGRPIVASDLPSVTEVVSKDTAILVTPGDQRSLAEGISKALLHDEHISALVSRAREAAKDHSWIRRAELLLNTMNAHSRNRISAQAQFIKTISVGIVAAAIYLSLVYAFTEFAGIRYAISALLAYGCVLVLNFHLLKIIFIGGSRRISHEFSRYIFLVLINVILNEAATYVLVEVFNMWYMLAQFLVIGALAIMNFFAYRSQVFRITLHDAEKNF